MKQIWPWLLASLLVIAAYFGYRALARPELRGTPVQAQPLVTSAALTGSDGRTHRLEDFRGKVTLVFFGYANCPDVCPLTLGNLARTYEDLGSPRDLQVAMITVDPENDTPGRLRSYMKQFNPAFLGLTGEPSEIARTAAAFYVFSNNRGGGLVDHSDQVMVVDRQGRLRLIYNQEKLGRGELHADLPEILRW
ncbi:protein SCO1/2 [Deinobacterium chartae]|uniref:Protein SCO1/2 n=1 Tax=Deinobacterium chartae TaxID=521158 RepID=A0A841I3J9_9DEIO|nr:SCO family protein [Deinobacterium chartae]MBB6099616.1 protein SCO1/2 [Deinobacterium chartae]